MKTKKRPPISQRAFNRKVEEMGYEVWDTGGGCQAYGKEISMFGKTFRVLLTSDLALPDVKDHEYLMGGIWSEQGQWHQTFSDAKELLNFAERAIEEKANSQTSVKIYEALAEKRREFKNYKPWRKYLDGHNIKSKDYDPDLANDEQCILVCDPFPTPGLVISILSIPEEVAEKFLILGVP